ncbi:MAG: polysaccharide deacetylase family protein [Clostridia bacterium]|nr:polysaccharide deacetylase family protein [Clostridia bacterium]
MAIVSMRFPGGAGKAFTISYDDGVESDFRLADLMRRYGIRGTFNINSGIKRILEDTPQTDLGEPRSRMNRTRFLEFFKQNRDLCEIAAHGLNHAWMTKMERSCIAWEVLADRKNLETLLGVPCRGFAYPYGVFNDDAVEALDVGGFLYARTTKTTKSFDLPEDPLRWACTAKHTYSGLMELAEQFVALDTNSSKGSDRSPYLFSVWGHSYEFNMADNWDVIEKLFSCVGGRDDIWYCTNEEYFRYVRAYHSLEFFADQSAVYNPTATPVCLSVMAKRSEPLLNVTVNPGETVSFGGK